MSLRTYYWYTVAVQFITEDENTGKTKKVKETYLVKGVSITDAEKQVVTDLDGLQRDYRILNVSESKIARIVKPEKTELNEE